MDVKLMTLVVMAIWSLPEAQSRGTPPVILNWKNKKEFLRRGNSEMIHCLLASGAKPQPTYKWMYEDKRGQLQEVINNTKIAYSSYNGTLFISKSADNSPDGNYTCIASNEYGSAMTPPLSIEEAVVTSFPGKENSPSTIMRAYVSEYIKLECKNAKDLLSKPPAEISWQRGNWKEPKLSLSKLPKKDNLAVDPDGTLHFLWVEDDDFGFVYVCSATNSKEQATYTNTHSIKLEKEIGTPDIRQPSLVYSADVTAMAGTTAELTCIFSYYHPGEKLEIVWQHHANRVGEGQVLSIKVIVPDDKQNVSGIYMCEGLLGSGRKPATLRLTVISPPEFEEGQELKAMSVPLGKDAVFRCGTTSYKTYQEAPVWYVNSKKLLDCEDPSKMVCPERKADGSNSIKCVPRCDGFPDCDNQEDEQECGTRQCPEGDKLCQGICINFDADCDPGQPCHYPFFECKDKSGCIDRASKCDGTNDCKDRSDERHCPGGSPISVQQFLVSSDRRELTLPDVTLDDQMCFQCSVKNQYGMVFGSGCLTVIDKIWVLLKPNETYHVKPGMYMNIGADARTDSLYQMKFTWWLYNETKDEEGNIHTEAKEIPVELGSIGQYFQLSQSGKNLTMIIPDVKKEDKTTDKYDAYQAMTRSKKYALIISHTFETVIVNFTVVGEEVNPPVTEEIVTKASLNLWFIALILAVLILFVVIALIVCYMYRNRGGTYPLDKKEHQAGHDPAQELKDNAFHDVGRVDDEYDDDKPRGDEVSLSDSVKPYESDEDMTAEYGEDLDLSRFNEEGSFIFQYGDKKNKAKEVTV